MKHIDLTLPTPQENLTLDETLLDRCDTGQDEVLRFWEPEKYFVVLGYSNKIHREVNLKSCSKDRIPILRRISGGGTVLQGPGCLNYSLILKIPDRGPLKSISETNRFIMHRHRDALQPLMKTQIHVRGCTDLVLDKLKFSGNSQRRKRHALLFHGTFLLDFDIGKIEKYLSMPSRQPAYRYNRPHIEFLTNLSLSRLNIIESLKKSWGNS